MKTKQKIKPCIICSKPGTGYYPISEDGERKNDKPYCREHLEKIRKKIMEDYPRKQEYKKPLGKSLTSLWNRVKYKKGSVETNPDEKKD